jgi:hypothetical protein
MDNVISLSYGPDLSITHGCIDGDENKQLKNGIADKLFREKDPTFFVVQGTKNCMTKSREALCPVLTAIKPCLPLTLLTRLCKDGKIV